MIPSHRQFVINPGNPQAFVYDGILATTGSTSEHIPQVLITVSIVDSAQEQEVEIEALSALSFQNYGLNTMDLQDSVPTAVLRTLYFDLLGRQIPCVRIFGDIGFISELHIVGDLSDEILDTFPIIQYRIHTDSGNDVVIRLDGRDYVGPFDGRIRKIQLRGDPQALTPSLGLTTLSKIALFVDNVNRTIGFGEPL